MSEARLNQRLMALLAASLSGTAMVMAQHLAVSLFMHVASDVGAVSGSVRGAVSVGRDSLPLICVLVVLFGCPLWWGLQALGLRGRRAMTIAAGAVALLLGLVPAFLLIGLAPWAVGVAPFVLAAVLMPGAVAGWTLHRVAYGRNPKP